MSAAVQSGSWAGRGRWSLLLAYPLLVLAGLLTRREIFPLLALVALVTAVLLPKLASGEPSPWLLWLSLQGLLLASALLGYADLLLKAVPLLINVPLAWWFGRTLLTARPLVARCIIVMEGKARLRERGVARYARQLTAFWAILLTVNAVLLAVLLLCAERSGMLLRFGVTPPLRIDEGWASAWLHVGGYAVVVAAFALEYPYRRWRLRHLQHQSMPQTLLRLALIWPRVVHGEIGKT